MKRLLSIILAALMAVSVFSVVPLTAGAVSITEVAIDKLFEPAEGNSFDDTARCATKGYTIDHISWYDYNNNKWMTSSDKFVEGNIYEANINVKADEGYSFAEINSVTGTINSQSAVVGRVTMEDPEEYLNFSLKFTATESNLKWDLDSIYGVNEPVAGCKPDYSYNDEEDVSYNVDAFEWRNPDNDTIYGKNTVFEAGETYQARFYLSPKKGSQFDYNMRMKINGEYAEVSEISGYKRYERICVKYNFIAKDEQPKQETTEAYEETTEPETNEISEVNISISDPKPGETPDYIAASDNGAVVESISWWNKTEQYFLFNEDTFKQGVTYSAKIKIYADEGKIFVNPTVTVNGKPASVSKIDGKDVSEYLQISCDFTAGEESEVTTAPETQPQTDKPAEPQETTKAPEIEPETEATTSPETEAKTEATTEPKTEPETQLQPETTTAPETEPETTKPQTTEPATVKPADNSTVKPDDKTNGSKTTSKPKAKKSKKTNTLTVKAKAKTIKLKKLKKKNYTIKPLTVKKAKGKVTYKLVKSGTNKKIYKYLKINKKGAITIKKWKKAKKGTYKIKIIITAAGDKTYKKGSKTVTVKIKVK